VVKIALPLGDRMEVPRPLTLTLVLGATSVAPTGNAVRCGVVKNASGGGTQTGRTEVLPDC